MKNIGEQLRVRRSGGKPWRTIPLFLVTDFRSFKRLNIEVPDTLLSCNGDWVALLHYNP